LSNDMYLSVKSSVNLILWTCTL